MNNKCKITLKLSLSSIYFILYLLFLEKKLHLSRKDILLKILKKLDYRYIFINLISMDFYL